MRGANVQGFNRQMPPPQEVDIESPPNDHLGDYVELQGPYEAATAAQRQVEMEPDNSRADPDDVKQAFGTYGAAPYSQGTQVRQVMPDTAHPSGFILNPGANTAQEVAPWDPYRTSVKFINHTPADVYLSPDPNQGAGWGSMVLIPGQEYTSHARSKWYLFTLAAFTNPDAKEVTVVTERYA